MLINLDSGFISRVVHASLGLAAVVFLAVLATASAAPILSYVGGVAVAELILKALEIVVRESFRPRGSPPGRTGLAAGVFVGHWVISVLVLFLLNHFRLLNPLGFCGGFLIVQTVLVAKAVGLLYFGKGTRGETEQLESPFRGGK